LHKMNKLKLIILKNILKFRIKLIIIKFIFIWLIFFNNKQNKPYQVSNDLINEQRKYEQ